MEGRKAVVVGAGQPRHEQVGNGRAIAIFPSPVLTSQSSEGLPVDGGTLAITRRDATPEARE